MSADRVQREYVVLLPNGQPFTNRDNYHHSSPEFAWGDVATIRELGDLLGIKFGELSVFEREARLTYSPWIESDWRPAED